MGANSSKKQIKALKSLDTDQIHIVEKSTFIAKVIDCYDGDTCTIAFFIGKIPVKIKLRLLGIDTAEMPKRKDGSDRTAEELELAYAAKDFLSSLVLNKCVYVELAKWGKWGGRVVGQIYCIDKKGNPVGSSLSDQLLEAQLAVPYDGSKKTTDWNVVYQTWKNKIINIVND